jgi:hypothetical protein
MGDSITRTKQQKEQQKRFPVRNLITARNRSAVLPTQNYHQLGNLRPKK